MSAATYTVTATSQQGCTATATVTITQPIALIAATVVSAPIACNGETGVVAVYVEGGTSAYSYLWSTGSTVNSTTVVAGQYTVTVIDANGCSTTSMVNISQPKTISAVKDSLKQVSCYGAADGVVSFNPKGGTPPYTYLWNDGSTLGARYDLAPGKYVITITDANGCSIVIKNAITQPDAIVTATVKVDATYNGAANGSATVSVISGGTPAFTYLWNNGKTTATISGLAAGTYTATVTDANGCSATASVTIMQPAAVCSTFNSSHNSGYYTASQVPSIAFYRNYLIANFATVFPNGLKLTTGCGQNALTLTSAQAAIDFMPSSGNPGPLTQSYINPLASNLSNALASQLVGLTLNIQFDQFDAAWSPSTITFDQLVVDSGSMKGLTVAQVYQEGLKKLTGCGSTYSASELRSMIAVINSSWYLGQKQNNVLTCPSQNPPRQAVAMNEFELSVYPNPSRDQINLAFDANANATCTVKIIDMTGKVVLDKAVDAMTGRNTITYNINDLPRGIYMVQFVMNDIVKQVKVVVQ